MVAVPFTSVKTISFLFCKKFLCLKISGLYYKFVKIENQKIRDNNEI